MLIALLYHSAGFSIGLEKKISGQRLWFSDSVFISSPLHPLHQILLSTCSRGCLAGSQFVGLTGAVQGQMRPAAWPLQHKKGVGSGALWQCAQAAWKLKCSGPSVAIGLNDFGGMPCTQCARSAKFWMSANTRTLVLAPFHKFLVLYQGFFGFPSIWDVAYLNCQPFPPRRGPSTKCTQSTRPGSRRRHCRHCSEPRIRRGGSIRPAEYSFGQIVPKPWSTSR